MNRSDRITQYERRNKLPELSGTFRQIAWARDIRYRLINELAAIDMKKAAKLSKITSAKRWIEEYRPYVGNARKLVWTPVTRTPAECRAMIWRNAEAFKDTDPSFNLVGFMRFIAGKSDEWVMESYRKPIRELRYRMPPGLPKWIESMGGNPECSILARK